MAPFVSTVYVRRLQNSELKLVCRVNTAIARGVVTQTDDSLAELGLSAQARPSLRDSAFGFIVFFFCISLSGPFYLSAAGVKCYWYTDHTQTHHTRWDSSGRHIPSALTWSRITLCTHSSSRHLPYSRNTATAHINSIQIYVSKTKSIV